MPRLLEICLGCLATEAYFKNASVGHSFIAIEAVNHGLSTENFVVTFSEFLMFNENAISSLILSFNFPEIFGFLKGGGL